MKRLIETQSTFKAFKKKCASIVNELVLRVYNKQEMRGYL